MTPLPLEPEEREWWEEEPRAPSEMPSETPPIVAQATAPRAVPSEQEPQQPEPFTYQPSLPENLFTEEEERWIEYAMESGDPALMRQARRFELTRIARVERRSEAMALRQFSSSLPPALVQQYGDVMTDYISQLPPEQRAQPGVANQALAVAFFARLQQVGPEQALREMMQHFSTENMHGQSAAAPQNMYGQSAAAPQNMYGQSAAAPQNMYGQSAAAPGTPPATLSRPASPPMRTVLHPSERMTAPTISGRGGETAPRLRTPEDRTLAKLRGMGFLPLVET